MARKSKLPTKPSKKKTKVRRANTKVQCPPIPVTPSFYDKKHNLFYRVGPKGGIQSSRSHDGRYTSARTDRIGDELREKLEKYSSICKSGDISDLNGDDDGNAFIVKEGKNWYAIGRKGGILILKPGKTKWTNINADDAPVDIRIWQVKIKEKLKLERQYAAEQNNNRKLNIWLTQNTHVLRLDDARLRLRNGKSESLQERVLDTMFFRSYGGPATIFTSIWWDTESRELLKRKKRGWELTLLIPKKEKKGADEWNNFNDAVRKIRGTMYADEAMSIWTIERNNISDGALVPKNFPWMLIKEGPNCRHYWKCDFSDVVPTFKKIRLDDLDDLLKIEEKQKVRKWCVEEKKRKPPQVQAPGDGKEDQTPRDIQRGQSDVNMNEDYKKIYGALNDPEDNSSPNVKRSFRGVRDQKISALDQTVDELKKQLRDAKMKDQSNITAAKRLLEKERKKVESLEEELKKMNTAPVNNDDAYIQGDDESDDDIGDTKQGRSFVNRMTGGFFGQ